MNDCFSKTVISSLSIKAQMVFLFQNRRNAINQSSGFRNDEFFSTFKMNTTFSLSLSLSWALKNLTRVPVQYLRLHTILFCFFYRICFYVDWFVCRLYMECHIFNLFITRLIARDEAIYFYAFSFYYLHAVDFRVRIILLLWKRKMCL